MKLIDKIAFLLLGVVSLASIFGFFETRTDPDVPRRPGVVVAPPQGEPLPPRNPTRDPIVMVDMGKKATTSLGTAFSLESNGVWLTARHVVDGCDKVGLMTGPSKAAKVRQIWIHPTADLAVLSQSLRRPALTMAARAPVIGEQGYGVGYPQGKPGEVVGKLLGRATSRSTGRYKLDEPVLIWSETARFPDFSGDLAGISGGPLLAQDGTVLGVIVSGTLRRGRFNTVAPSSLALALQAAELTPDSIGKTVTVKNPIEPQELVDLGQYLREKGAVAQVICLVN
ncbi:MAG: serine protease [Alphaproteobacteria bacterium]|nr:serine protease [Alphaproteobacteria bacterium]